MNSESSKTANPHRLVLNLKGKINWKINDKSVALSSLSIYYSWRNVKKVTWEQ